MSISIENINIDYYNKFDILTEVEGKELQRLNNGIWQGLNVTL